jgi:hypothetical protein
VGRVQESKEWTTPHGGGESAGYDVFLTVDKGVPHQQNLAIRRSSVLVITSRTNQMEDLLPAVGANLVALGQTQPGQVAFAS